MEDKIIEGNRLVAEFMGAKFVTIIMKGFPSLECAFFEEKSDNPFPLNSLKYHYSWDWLMPVVEKINEVYKTSCDIDFINAVDDRCNDLFTKTPITANKKMVYQRVVKFIDFFNQFKKVNQ